MTEAEMLEAVEAAKRYLNVEAEVKRVGNMLSTDATMAAFEVANEELAVATAHLPSVSRALLSLHARAEEVRAEERERCAKVAIEFAAKHKIITSAVPERWRKHMQAHVDVAAEMIAEAIRSLPSAGEWVTSLRSVPRVHL